MSKLLCGVITSWRAECISLPLHRKKNTLLVERTESLSVSGSSENANVLCSLQWLSDLTMLNFLSVWWIMQTYLFMEKVIFGWNLSRIRPYLHWSKHTIKMKNAYICIANALSVSSMNSDFNTTAIWSWSFYVWNMRHEIQMFIFIYVEI